MSEYGIESPEERRDRYIRLARAAADAAEKTPTDEARAMYLKLAVSWAEMAEESSGDQAAAYAGEPLPSSPSRNSPA